MKNMFFALAIAFSFAATAQAADPMPMPTFNLCGLNDSKVNLPQGTVVHLETNQKIDCSAMTEGQTIKFKVISNVMAEGEVAIRTGSLALGIVKQVKSGTYNGPAEIRVELQYVHAVDGQQVALNGNELTIVGDQHGRGADCTIRTGTSITANVTNTIAIDVD